MEWQPREGLTYCPEKWGELLGVDTASTLAVSRGPRAGSDAWLWLLTPRPAQGEAEGSRHWAPSIGPRNLHCAPTCSQPRPRWQRGLQLSQELSLPVSPSQIQQRAHFHANKQLKSMQKFSKTFLENTYYKTNKKTKLHIASKTFCNKIASYFNSVVSSMLFKYLQNLGRRHTNPNCQHVLRDPASALAPAARQTHTQISALENRHRDVDIRNR